MKRNMTLMSYSLAAVAALMFSGLEARAAAMQAKGTLATVDAKAGTFSIQEKGVTAPQTFHWNNTTHFVADGKPASAGDLRSGEHLRVHYEKSGNTMTATEVVVQHRGQSAAKPSKKHKS
jgi:hypothetical protein